MFKPRSFHLQWHITERCNLRCKHCYLDPIFLKSELPLQKLINIFEKYIEQIKIWGLPKQATRISFTGGEPLVRKDFFELLKKCYENRDIIQYGILTNGTLLNNNIVGKLKKLGVSYIQVSLEGTEKTNDYIRGKGTFKKIIQAIKLLKKVGIPVNISMTVSKLNLKDVSAVIDLSREMGTSLGIRRFVPTGRGKKEMQESLLSPLEVKKLFLEVLRAQKDPSLKIGMGCEDGILAQEMHYLPLGCSAGYASFTVVPNGDVYPCRKLPIYSGNLLKQSFSEIYYNSEPLQKLRNLNNINNDCQSCPYFNECHGGAKCVSYAYFGDSFAPDPQCWRLFQELPDTKLKWKSGQKKEKERMDQKWIDEA